MKDGRVDHRIGKGFPLEGKLDEDDLTRIFETKEVADGITGIEETD